LQYCMISLLDHENDDAFISTVMMLDMAFVSIKIFYSAGFFTFVSTISPKYKPYVMNTG
jgi:hypothetical protein